MVAIWRAVAEDFAAFDVDITTEDPGGWAPVAVLRSATALQLAVCHQLLGAAEGHAARSVASAIELKHPSRLILPSGDAGLIKSSSSDNAFGMRVAIGGSSYDWFGSGAGGVAYVGVFSRPDLYYQPAYVFTAQLGNGFPKYVWEAVSHEVGHSLGLSHDGRSDTATYQEYYEGDPGPGIGAMGTAQDQHAMSRISICHGSE